MVGYKNVGWALVVCSAGWLLACASIEPATQAEQPQTYSYTHPVVSGLKPRSPFPNADDVCVLLYSNRLVKPYETDDHLLIACPKHEQGAIYDRKALQKAVVVGNAKHWVLMQVPKQKGRTI